MKWFDFLSKKPSPLVGIDISDTGIRLVELSRDRSGKFTLDRFAYEPLSSGWVIGGGIEKFDEVSEALRRLIRKSGSRSRNAAFALPSSAVITKMITLPAGMSEDELTLQVEMEAGHYIPFALDEVALDYCLGDQSESVPGDVDVFIAAVRRERVQDLQGLAESAGLLAHVIDVESYAARAACTRIIELLPYEQPSQITVALFEVSGNDTTLQVIRGGELIYERDQSFGDQQLTQLISRHFGLSEVEAERKKHADEPITSDYKQAVISPYVTTAVQEFSRALQFFFTSTQHNRVDHILLSGSSVSLPDLCAMVAEKNGSPCGVADPFMGMHVPTVASRPKFIREAPSYLKATGLALRRFSL